MEVFKRVQLERLIENLKNFEESSLSETPLTNVGGNKI